MEITALGLTTPAVSKEIPSSQIPQASTDSATPSTGDRKSTASTDIGDTEKVKVAKPIEPNKINDAQPTAISTDTTSTGCPLLYGLWRSPDRINQIGTLDRQTKKFKNRHVSSVSVAVSRALEYSAAGIEVYFACAEYSTSNSRNAANASGAWGFWMDIDCGDKKDSAGKGYPTEDDALLALKKFCKDAGLPAPTHIVSSGGGLHVYWVMDSVVEREKWQEYAVKLKALTNSLNFLADDSRTSDIASVLRVPGTLNHKYNPPRPVSLRHASADFIERSAMLNAIDSAHNRLCSAAATQVSSYGNADKNDKKINRPPSPSGHVKSASQIFAEIMALLEHIDPNCGYEYWLHVLMAVFHETAGSNDGLALADMWSSKGSGYKGTKEIEIKWRSFRADTPNPVTIATLIKMAHDAGADVAAIMRNADDFGLCDTEVIRPTAVALSKCPLAKYSLRDLLPSLEKQMVEEVLILGSIALLGQATVIYALANTGKTLIVLCLIIESIKQGLIKPSELYYINMDDNSRGLVDKGRLAEEYGFHMIADGHQEFEAKNFRAAMEKMIATDTAKGVIVVLDTLKKFVNTMDKGRSSDFAKVIRQFSLKGGTVIALSHANKHPGADGRTVYSGTTDIVDDFDCAYTLATVSQQVDANLRVVEFTNIKRRGNVALSAAYSYVLEREVPYNELLLSVQAVDTDQLVPIKFAAEVQSDAPVITAIEACIKDGVNTKMKLADASAKRANISKRYALQIIDRYTGEDTTKHRWNFTVGNRGAKVYGILSATPPEQQLEEPEI